MKMAPSEAVDLFRKWFSDGSLICWKGRFAGFGFVSFGRLISVNDNEIRLMSDDRKSELVVILDDSLEFRYADSRIAPEDPDAKKYEDSIYILFTPPPDPDFIMLAAQS